MAGPVDLADNDQLRASAYVLDVVARGNWLVQQGFAGEFASKPPAHAWLAAFFVRALPAPIEVSLAMASVVGVLGVVLIVYAMGRPIIGARAAALGAATIAVSPFGFKMVTLVRTDALFAAATALCAWAAWSAVSRGASWVPVWVAAALATLVKGPLGIAIGLSGLLGVLRDFREQLGDPRCRRAHVVGIVALVAITIGWVAAALWWSGGDADLIRTLFVDELARHAIDKDGADAPGSHGWVERVVRLPVPVLYLLTRYAPWSVLAAFGVWRCIRMQSDDLPVLHFERFCLCWLFAPLALMGLAPHQRADIVFPVVAPAALLAGRELCVMVDRLSARAARGAAAGALLTAIGAAGFYHNVVRAADARVVESEGMRALAKELRAIGIDAERLIYGTASDAVTDEPTGGRAAQGLQVFLGTRAPIVTAAEAGELAREAGGSVVVVVGGSRVGALGLDGDRVREVARWPAGVQPAKLVVVEYLGGVEREDAEDGG